MSYNGVSIIDAMQAIVVERDTFQELVKELEARVKFLESVRDDAGRQVESLNKANDWQARCIKELEQQLAAMSEPPVWCDGPPPEPGVWFARVKNEVNEIATSGEWNDWFLEEWDEYEFNSVGDPTDWQHAPVPANLKPPVGPNPVPKPDPCEEFIAEHGSQPFGPVMIGGEQYDERTIRHLWPHIEAAIKGGAR